MGDEFTVEDLLIILRRRFKFFIIPVILLLPVLVVGVMLLPAQYRSEGVMLIESPQISKDLVQTATSSKALERIDVIRQRITARPQLLEIADKTKLFQDRRRISDSKKVKKMKERLRVQPIRSELLINTPGREAVAFRISYRDKSPYKATAVANEFMSRFESEDRRKTAKDASDTTEFFEERTKEYELELKTQRDEIARFKQDNGGSLPDELELHQRQLERLNNRLNSIDAQIASLDEDERFVESQIASNAAGGGNDNSPENRLLNLRAQLAELRSRYTEAHPEVQALLGEVRALERQLAPGRELQRLQRRLDDAEETLLQAEKNEEDPAVIERLRAEADALSDRFLRQATSGGGLSSSAQTFLLQSRMVSFKKRRRSLNEQRTDLLTRIDDLEARIIKTPAVQSVLEGMEEQEKFIREKLDDNKRRQLLAEQSEDLQVQDRAERIRPIEAAVLPEKPSSPNRPGLIAVSLILSLMIGAATAMLSEFLNATVRGRAHLTNIIGEPPLAVIPMIPGDEQGEGRFNTLMKIVPKPPRRNEKLDAEDLGGVPAE